jgi:hypothetical protein
LGTFLFGDKKVPPRSDRHSDAERGFQPMGKVISG